MKKDKLNEALDHIDFELIDEYVKEKESLQQRNARRKTVATLVPLAACLVILLSIGSTIFGYYLGFSQFNEESFEKNEQMQGYFEKEGIFIFEYGGKTYQALVMPISSGNAFDIAEGESVSIKDVGELLSKVSVTDKNGNVATMEIYTTKIDTSEDTGDVLLKLDSGYFLAKKINKNKN